MPAYDYECAKCGRIEVTHRMDDVQDRCPLCNSKKFTKLIRMPNLQTCQISSWNWALENNGKGRFIQELCKRPDPNTKNQPGRGELDDNAYCKSYDDAVRKGDELGLKPV